MAPDLFMVFKAIIAGFVVAVPVGAIGAMCMRRALQGLWIDGLFTGLGAALADAVLASAAMLGLTLITRYVLDHEGPLRLVGGIVLIVLGIRMIRTHRIEIDDRLVTNDYPTRGWQWRLGDFVTGFGLTIINPATLLAFAGVLAGLGLFAGETAALFDDWMVLIGVFVGSMLWWVTLTVAASAMRRHASDHLVSGTYIGLGILLVGLGFLSIASLINLGP